MGNGQRNLGSTSPREARRSVRRSAEDTDADSSGDVCDAYPSNLANDANADKRPETPNPGQADSNGSGVGDAYEPTLVPIGGAWLQSATAVPLLLWWLAAWVVRKSRRCQDAGAPQRWTSKPS